MLTNNSLKDIELTIDFRESENIGITTNPNSQKDSRHSLQKNKMQINFMDAMAQRYNIQNQNYTSNKEDQLIVNSFVKMKQTKVFICTVTLKPNWKLHTKLKFSLKNVNIEKQRQALQYIYEELRQFIENYKTYNRKMPVS